MTPHYVRFNWRFSRNILSGKHGCLEVTFMISHIYCHFALIGRAFRNRTYMVGK